MEKEELSPRDKEKRKERDEPKVGDAPKVSASSLEKREEAEPRNVSRGSDDEDDRDLQTSESPKDRPSKEDDAERRTSERQVEKAEAEADEERPKRVILPERPKLRSESASPLKDADADEAEQDEVAEDRGSRERPKATAETDEVAPERKKPERRKNVEAKRRDDGDADDDEEAAAAIDEAEQATPEPVEDRKPARARKDEEPSTELTETTSAAAPVAAKLPQRHERATDEPSTRAAARLRDDLDEDDDLEEMTGRERTFRVIVLALLLIAATAFAYQKAWTAGYIWDDDIYVTTNELLTAPDGLKRIWFSLDSPSQYFPLVYTSFRIEHALWGVTNRVFLQSSHQLLLLFLRSGDRLLELEAQDIRRGRLHVDVGRDTRRNEQRQQTGRERNREPPNGESALHGSGLRPRRAHSKHIMALLS